MTLEKGPRDVSQTQVFLGLGSNVDRESNFRTALDALASQLIDFRCSPVYECESVGHPGPCYFNMVVTGRTHLSLEALVEWVKRQEVMQGRHSGLRSWMVPMDIDVLLYGDLIGSFSGVILPHRALLDQAFVLRPLADLAPDHLHPLTKTRFSALWRDMRDEWNLQRVATPLPIPAKQVHLGGSVSESV